MQLIKSLQLRLREHRTAMWSCALLAVIAFIFQVLGINGHERYGEPYLIARNIIAGKGYVFIYPYTFHESVTAYIPPLYVYLQVPFLASGLGETAIQVFNLLCLQAACYLVYRFFRPYCSALTSLLIYAALLFYFPFWALAYSLEPNALNILLIVATVYVLRDLAQEQKRIRCIILGVLIGLQLLVRPDLLLGTVLFTVWLLWIRKKQLKLVLTGLCLSAAIAFAIVTPWTIRNYVVFHKFVLVSANAGMNLFTGNNPVATGEFSETGITRESERIFHEVLAYSRTHDQVDVDRLRYQIAMNWMIEHPGEVIVLDTKKILYHWFGRNSTGREYRMESPAFLLAFRLLSIVLVCAGAIGIFQLPKNVRSLLLTLFLYSTAVSAIFFVQSRHRPIKVDPFLLPLAVIGVVRVVEVVRRREIKASNEVLSAA